MSQSTIRNIELELAINTDRQTAWTCLFEHFSDWWPSDFLCIPDAKRIQFEPRVGGRVFEETEDGRSILWGTCVFIMPGESMEFVGHMTPTWGGPSVTMIRYHLSDAEGGGTKFRLTDSVLGNVSDEQIANLDQGWRYLCEAYVKFAESYSG